MNAYEPNDNEDHCVPHDPKVLPSLKVAHGRRFVCV